MPKNRISIPRPVREQVESEFNHRCAICGADKPHLHHIDENPSNNDPSNLIPLCPNCHLNDQHNPTRLLDPKLLGLFRLHKDPSLLKPQFYVLFRRMQFLDCITDDSAADTLHKAALELADFVAVLQMGEFYSARIRELAKKPAYAYSVDFDDWASRQRYQAQLEAHAQEYRDKLKANRDAIVALAIELLRFQNWAHEPRSS